MAKAPKPKRLALPQRFSAALTEDAYSRLRALNSRYGLSNNYLLTVLLERLDDYADPDKLDVVYRDFIAEYGAPDPNQQMTGPKDAPSGGQAQ
ncbi:MAG: hypothetical protein AAFW46_11890 [Pseudomonadota bacterium]